MRKPSLYRAFKLPDRRGLSDVQTGHAKFDEVLQDTGEHHLTVMCAGKSPPSPAELLGAVSFARTVEEASRQFDHVVIDSPPVLGLADAPLISKAVEGTVFVIEAGHTRSSQARRALDRLAAVRAEIVGAVLTKLDSQSSGYGYGYGYNYSYGAV
jgi:capsular exopolysaccharide synthesis family protein